MASSGQPARPGNQDPLGLSHRWAEVRPLVEAALELPLEAREAFLADRCGEDVLLRGAAEAQIDACERAARSNDFLAEPAAAFAAPLVACMTTGEHLRDRASTDESERARRGAGIEATLRVALAGQYDVMRELGRGGMSFVYLAEDRRHERLVALKVLDPTLGALMSAERFLGEIRMTARLTHPHILPLHDSGEANGLLYYVMPFVDGENLRERLAREKTLSIGESMRLLREVASALAYAHRHGIVHRDIKPANILFEDGHAVVADFGIARAVHRASEAPEPEIEHSPEKGRADALTQPGMSPGTPGYMAPEQVRGDAAIDHRADLYSLGVVAYEVLAGVHPFGTRTSEALLAAQRDELPVPLNERRTDIPAGFIALVMRMLDRDRSERPQSASEVVTALDMMVTNLARTNTRSPRPVSIWRSPRVVTAAGALLALLAVTGAIAAVVRVRRDPVPRAASATRRGPEDARAGMAIRSVAVLPFVNTSGEPEDDYLGDGLTDELVRTLERVPGLQLVGRTSSYAFKGKHVTAQEIGRTLGVGALVGGTVRRAEGRLRVTAQLVNTADGKVLWDSVYDRRPSDLLSLQNEVTRAIVAAVTPSSGVRSRVGRDFDAERGTADQAAYDLYLKGRYYWIQRGATNLALAIACFREAIARDPTFARAHAGLAMAYSTLPDYVPGAADSATSLTAASAQRAAALDSTLVDAQLALGIALDMRLHFREALVRYRTAVALDPSSVTAHHWLGISLLNLGRTDEALGELRHAAELDPLATTPATALGTALLFARRFPEARTASRRALALDSTFTFANWTLGLAQVFDGQPEAAIRTFENGTRMHPGDSRLASGLVVAYAAAGRWADATRIRSQLGRPGVDRYGWNDAAVAELVFGNREPLVRILTSEEGQRRYVTSGAVLGCNPLLDPLWADARFRAAMRRLTVDQCPLERPWPISLPAAR